MLPEYFSKRLNGAKSSKIFFVSISIVFCLTALMTGCNFFKGNNTLSNPVPFDKERTSETDWISVFFSENVKSPNPVFRGGPDRKLVHAIDKSRISVDMAMHSFDLWSVRDALIDAHRRGVAVRVVTESDNFYTPELQQLREVGIQVLGDQAEGTMHHKFIVIDRREIWTGSMNLTIKGAYQHDDNLVRVLSPSLAEDYTVEFEEMFVNNRFGAASKANTPNPAVFVNGNKLEVRFSPDDQAADLIVRLIEGAEESIHFMAFSFTSDRISEAIIDRFDAGVSVTGIFDEDQYRSNAGTEFNDLLLAGINVRLDGNPEKMHHKVIIIDKQIVITGSYNLSNNAETINDENVLVIHNSKIADQFIEEFTRVFSSAKLQQ